MTRSIATTKPPGRMESRKDIVHPIRRFPAMIVGVTLMFGITSVAHAVPITLEFTVGDFPPTFSGIEAPFDPVSGVIVYEAAALGSPIESLTSISLQIGDHSFTVDEVSFISNPPSISTSDLIGGSLNGVGGVTLLTDDFSLQYDRCDRPGVGANFVYASADNFGIFRSTSFSSFTLSGPGPVACGEPAPAPVPEPGTATLLLMGLTGVLMARRRRPATSSSSAAPPGR